MRNRNEEMQSREEAKAEAVKKVKRGFIWGVLGSLAVVVGLNSFTIVEPGKEKAGATLGTIHSEQYDSGFHIVNPLADFYEYDLQEVTHTWENVGVPAQDNLKTNMDVHVTGQFMPGFGPQIRSEQGSQKTFLSSQVDKRVRATVIEVGKELAETSQAFFGETTLAVMEDTIVERLNGELNARGYKITALKFSDINLPPVVTEAIVNTKKADQKVKTQQALLEIQEKQAQETVNTATANAQAAEQNAIAAGHVADAKLYEMQQEAAGNEALAKSVTPALIQLKQAEAALKWNGVMPTTVLGESTNMLMQMPK